MYNRHILDCYREEFEFNLDITINNKEDYLNLFNFYLLLFMVLKLNLFLNENI